MAALMGFPFEHQPAATPVRGGPANKLVCWLWRGLKAPDTGHPRYNKLWFTIGPQFSSDLYALLAPAIPNLDGRLSRNLGRINRYAEGVDGAVFHGGNGELGFCGD